MIKTPQPFLAVNESLHGPLPCSRTDSCFVSYASLLHKTKPPVPSLRLCPCPARPLQVWCWSLQCALGPVCSQCLWEVFFCCSFSRVFAVPLSSAAFSKLTCWRASFYGPPLLMGVQSQPITHWFVIRGRTGNEERQQNIYVNFFSLILWSWLNWSKRVTLFQGGIIDETAISHGAVFWYWNGAWNDKITCWVILGNVQIPGMFCLSHEQYLSRQWTWEETKEARTSLPVIGCHKWVLEGHPKNSWERHQQKQVWYKKVWPNSFARFTLLLIKWLKHTEKN